MNLQQIIAFHMKAFALAFCSFILVIPVCFSQEITSSKLKDIAHYPVAVRAKHPVLKKYCALLKEQGFIVECLDWPMLASHNIQLKCASLPEDSGRTLRSFLGKLDLEINDWRDNPKFADECDSGSVVINLEH